jgi:hypothetical protein
MRAFFDIAAIVIVLAAVFGYLNHKFLRLPHTIGLVVIALAVSRVVLGIDAVHPSLGLPRRCGPPSKLGSGGYGRPAGLTGA